MWWIVLDDDADHSISEQGEPAVYWPVGAALWAHTHKYASAALARTRTQLFLSRGLGLLLVHGRRRRLQLAADIS